MLLGLNMLGLVASGGAKTNDLLRLPGATLLHGTPPISLTLTTGEATLQLQTGGGPLWYVTPSMSTDGHLIASAHVAAGVSPASRLRPRLVVTVYSTTNQQWTDYADLAVFDGAVSISPDGTKLACITRRIAGAPGKLSILDLRTGAVTTASEGPASVGPSLSWSPDGQQIAFDAEAKRSAREKSIPSLQAIYMLDIRTGKVSRLADGSSPSWSPSGDRIAYYDYSLARDDGKGGWYQTNANRFSTMRLDGSGQKVLLTLGRWDTLHVPPVWSPDGKSILVNKLRDWDKSTMDVYLIDLDTEKVVRKFLGVQPVYAWASTK
jgi:Tol biopolymer transport system component